MEKQKVNELEKDIWFELKSLFHQMERMTFSDRVKELGELQKLYTVTRKVATKEPDEILPHLPKSTENLSKIADKDKWLNEVRGNDETFVDIAAPIGDFIFNQTDIVGTPGNDGMYYHYADVCKMLRRYSDSKLSELEKWCDEQFKHADSLDKQDGTETRYFGGKRDAFSLLKIKIQSLKAK